MQANPALVGQDLKSVMHGVVFPLLFFSFVVGLFVRGAPWIMDTRESDLEWQKKNKFMTVIRWYLRRLESQ